MRDVIITRQPIELFKLLKLEGLAPSGGAAKHLIADGQVSVNDSVETRKRRKIIDGDIVEFDAEKLRVRLEAPSERG